MYFFIQRLFSHLTRARWATGAVRLHILLHITAPGSICAPRGFKSGGCFRAAGVIRRQTGCVIALVFE